MLLNILIGGFMVVLTTAIHAAAMVLCMRVFTGRNQSPWERVSGVSRVVLLLFLASVAEVTAWACVYLVLGTVAGVEPALYFSTVTFTTLGYGDIVLQEQWRLLAALQAANGIIIFGWSTAIVIAAVRRLYFTPATEQAEGEPPATAT